MGDSRATAHLSFLGRTRAQGFEAQLIPLAPGAERPFDERDWANAFVVVERGVVEIEGQSGARRTFVGGDVLCLSGLWLRALRNRGSVMAVLTLVTRQSS